jgi:hypothetical protein
MEYVGKMNSGTMIHVSSLIKAGAGIRKLIRGIHRHAVTQTAWRSHKLTYIFQKACIGLNLILCHRQTDKYDLHERNVLVRKEAQ